MTTSQLKLISTSLWASSLTLLAGSTIRGDIDSRWLTWSLFIALAACVFTGWLIVEYVIQRECSRASVMIATAVGRALRADQDQPTPIR